MLKYSLSFFFLLSSLTILSQSPGIHKWLNDDVTNAFNVGAPLGLDDQRIVYFVFPIYDREAGVVIDQIAYSAVNEDGEWSQPVVMKHPVNDEFNNVVVGVDSSGTILYLLGRYNQNPRARIGLSKSTKLNGFWSKPEQVKVKGLRPRTEFYSFFITPDQKMMFATFEESKRYSDDIYFAKYIEEKAEFEKLRRLSLPLNTSSSEISPFFNVLDSTLYFARMVGQGDSANYDLFASKALDGDLTNWSNPEPLSMLNSPGFEAYYWSGINGKAFFTSDQFNFGVTDILTFDPRMNMLQSMQPKMQTSIVKPGIAPVEVETPQTYSMVKILDRNEMLINIDEEGVMSNTFDLNSVLVDSNDQALPGGVSFNVLDQKGDILRSTLTEDDGSIQIRNLDIQPGLRFIVDDVAFDHINMRILNRQGEIQTTVAIAEAEEFIFRKLNSERAVMTLLKEQNDTHLTAGMIEKFLMGELVTLTIEKEVAEAKGIIPAISGLTRVVLVDAKRNVILLNDFVQFFDQLGNLVKYINPIDHSTISYEELEDYPFEWIRLANGMIMKVEQGIAYSEEDGQFRLLVAEVTDAEELESMEDLIKNANKLLTSNVDEQALTTDPNREDVDRPASLTQREDSMMLDPVIQVDVALNDLDSQDDAQIWSEPSEVEEEAKPVNNAHQKKSSGADYLDEKVQRPFARSDVYVDVFFGFDSDQLEPRDRRQLQQIASAGMCEVNFAEGAADTIGASEYNERLALRRAEKVVEIVGRENGVEARGIGEIEATPIELARRVRIGLVIDLTEVPSIGDGKQALLVYHSLAQAQPESKYLELLSDVADYLKLHPEIGLKVQSHTDFTGSKQYNVTLSMKRANAIVQFMTQLGVSEKQLQPSWFGKSQLVSGCNSEEDCASNLRAMDRRSELIFFKR